MSKEETNRTLEEFVGAESLRDLAFFTHKNMKAKKLTMRTRVGRKSNGTPKARTWYVVQWYSVEAPKSFTDLSHAVDFYNSILLGD